MEKHLHSNSLKKSLKESIWQRLSRSRGKQHSWIWRKDQCLSEIMRINLKNCTIMPRRCIPQKKLGLISFGMDCIYPWGGSWTCMFVPPSEVGLRRQWSRKGLIRSWSQWQGLNPINKRDLQDSHREVTRVSDLDSHLIPEVMYDREEIFDRREVKCL